MMGMMNRVTRVKLTMRLWTVVTACRQNDVICRSTAHTAWIALTMKSSDGCQTVECDWRLRGRGLHVAWSWWLIETLCSAIQRLQLVQMTWEKRIANSHRVFSLSAFGSSRVLDSTSSFKSHRLGLGITQKPWGKIPKGTNPGYLPVLTYGQIFQVNISQGIYPGKYPECVYLKVFTFSLLPYLRNHINFWENSDQNG